VFLALTGTTYAATAAKNSVTSKAIKNGQIKSADVKDDALTGTDVDESTLEGIEGPRGPEGAQGAQGQRGVQGPRGERGPEGARGTGLDPPTALTYAGSDPLLNLTAPSATAIRATNGPTSSSNPAAMFRTSGDWAAAEFRNTSGDGLAILANSEESSATTIRATREVPGTALHVQGGLRIDDSSSSGSPAFVHTADNSGAGDNVCGDADQYAQIDNPYANNEENAILYATPNLTTPPAETTPVGVVYDPPSVGFGCVDDRWAITTVDGTAIADNSRYDVLVVTTGTN